MVVKLLLCRYIDDMIYKLELVGFGYYVKIDELEDCFGMKFFFCGCMFDKVIWLILCIIIVKKVSSVI